MVVTALIRVDLKVCQAAATPVVSTNLATTEAGGLLQSPVPTHGGVICTPTRTPMSTDTSAVATTAFLLVASAMIKVCVYQVIVPDI